MFITIASAGKLLGTGLIYVGLLAVEQGRPPDILEREIPGFEVSSVPMLVAVSKLRELGVMVSFEEVELDPNRDRIFNERNEPVGVRKLAFSLRLQAKSTRQILDALVNADGEYTWKLDTDSGMINIFPKSPVPGQQYAGSVLNWTVDKLDIKGKGRLAVLQEDLSLKAHNITLFWRGSYDHYDSPISLNTKSTPVIEILNKISSAPRQLCWTLAGFKGGRILTLVPCGPP